MLIVTFHLLDELISLEFFVTYSEYAVLTPSKLKQVGNDCSYSNLVTSYLLAYNIIFKEMTWH